MEQANRKPAVRQWREIAQEMAREQNPVRITQLSHELSEAFEAQYSPRKQTSNKKAK